MGFSLELFFNDLIEVLESDMKAAKKIRLIIRIVTEAKKYAKECGQIK